MVDITKGPGPNTTTITGPRTEPAAPPAQNVPVGSDVYDWHRVNEALREAGLDTWRIAGTNHTPVNNGHLVTNPAFTAVKDYTDADLRAEGMTRPPEFIYQEGNEYAIGVTSPDGRQMMKLTLSKGKPDAQGNYGYAVIGRSTQSPIETREPGYKEVQRLPFQDGHQELWGINTQTGVFEKMPGGPSSLGTEAPKGWNDIKQVDDSQGHMIWIGTDPEGKPFQQVPGSPVINTGKYVPGSVRQGRSGNKIVYRGQNTQTGEWEEIPSLGSEPAPIQTTTIGAITYQPDANGNLVPAPNVAQPVEGQSTRWVSAGGGAAKQQTFRNGDWQDDIDVPQKTVSPEAQRAAGALRPKGERYEILTNIDGEQRLLIVEADGNGGYTIPQDTKARRVPGSPPSIKPVTATSGEQEFITRYNPETDKQEDVRNPNWSPSAIADRTRQLTQLARTKQLELHARVGQAGYTDQDADRDFGAWWDTEIEPRRKQVAFDEDQQRRKQEQEDQAGRISAVSTASTIGQNQATLYQGQQKHMVGPGYAQQAQGFLDAISQGKRPPAMQASAYQYPMHDLNALAQYYTAQALQHISPTAAGIMGGGQPGALGAARALDLNSVIDRTRFLPSQQQGAVTININAAQPTQDTPPIGATPAAPAAPAMVAPSPWASIGNFGA